MRKRKFRIRTIRREQDSRELDFETATISGKTDSFTDKVLLMAMGLFLIPTIVYAAYLIGDESKALRNHEVAMRSDADNPDAMTEKEALHLVRKALGSTTEAEVADGFTASQFLTTREMLDWIRERSEHDGAITSMLHLPQKMINSQPLEEVLVRFSNRPSHSWRLAHLVHDDGGHWKIDFDSFARICSPSFWDPASGSAGEALVRVLLKPDHYYNGAFRCEKEWRSFKLWSPDHDQFLMAYVEIGSSPHRSMMRVLSKEKEPYAVTLMVERQGDPALNQCRINRVLSDGWYVGKNDFEND